MASRARARIDPPTDDPLARDDDRVAGSVAASRTASCRRRTSSIVAICWPSRGAHRWRRRRRPRSVAVRQRIAHRSPAAAGRPGGRRWPQPRTGSPRLPAHDEPSRRASRPRASARSPRPSRARPRGSAGRALGRTARADGPDRQPAVAACQWTATRSRTFSNVFSPSELARAQVVDGRERLFLARRR